jgi:hypothetical protein
MTTSTIFVDPIKGQVEKHCGLLKIKKIIGSPAPAGYLQAGIDGDHVLIHRLIYTHFHGPMPAHLVVDHINGNRQDNRIENLRLVTNSQNQQNRPRAMRHSKTGVKGVAWEQNRYRARIIVSGKRFDLGRYKTLDEAKKAYADAAAKLHTHNPCAN